MSAQPKLIMRALATLLILVSFLIAAPVLAQEPTPMVEPSAVTDDQVNAIAKQLYCPVCENIPLDVCPTQACAQWRDLIRLKLAQGQTEQQIKNYFVAQYGDRVLAAPPAEGMNWLVYIIPPVAFLAGAILVYRSLIAWKRPQPSTLKSERARPTIPDDEYVARLEEELRKG